MSPPDANSPITGNLLPASPGSEDCCHVLPAVYRTWLGVAPGPCFRLVSFPYPLNHWCLCCWLWARSLALKLAKPRACRPAGCCLTGCWFLPCILFVPGYMWQLSCLHSYPKTLFIMNLQLNEKCFRPVVWIKIKLDGKTQTRCYFTGNINIEFISALRVRIRTVMEDRIADDMLLNFMVKYGLNSFVRLWIYNFHTCTCDKVHLE